MSGFDIWDANERDMRHTRLDLDEEWTSHRPEKRGDANQDAALMRYPTSPFMSQLSVGAALRAIRPPLTGDYFGSTPRQASTGAKSNAHGHTGAFHRRG
jgi:hypothetical protein